MKRRDLLKIGGLIGTTVLAGCTSGTNASTSGPSNTSTTRSSAPSTATPTPVSLSEVEYPPGWSTEGLQDVKTAEKAHKDALEDVSFSRKFVGDTEGFPSSHKEYNAKVDADNNRALINRETTYPGGVSAGAYIDIYIDGETLYERTKIKDEEEYEYLKESVEFRRRYHKNGNICQNIDRFAYEPQGTVRAAGTTGIQFGVTGFSSEVGPDAPLRGENFGDVQDGVVTVTPEGQITSYDVNAGVKDETTSWEVRSADWSINEDISISEPDWVSNVV